VSLAHRDKGFIFSVRVKTPSPDSAARSGHLQNARPAAMDDGGADLARAVAQADRRRHLVLK
jgi:hypothetical protein